MKRPCCSVPGRRWLGRLAALLALLLRSTAAAAEPAADPLAFRAVGPGEFAFDTGVVRGRLGPPGRGNGLSTAVHVPTGRMLDRGTNGYGLFSHYRVFSDHRRYGVGAWDWPRESRLLENGAAEWIWRPAAERPFELCATYRWATPDALDLVTRVTPQTNLMGFEVFLASYLAEGFTNALVYSKSFPEGSAASWVHADPAEGLWQMFPRDFAAVERITDGRWRLEPNPVAWTLRLFLAAPIAVRRAPESGLTVALMAAPEDGFAIALPQETEGHYSVYLSLGGRDLAAGQAVSFRTRLWVAAAPSERQVLEHFQRWTASP